MYKGSQYNIVQELGEDITVYNVLTGGVLTLNGEYAQSFRRYEQTGDYNLLEADLLENLKAGNMIIPVEFNEFNYVEVMSNISRYSCSQLGLTIAPTTNCNFACPYCYEHDINYDTMTKETELEVEKFIDKKMLNKNRLSITWYGGEPLLNLTAIHNISAHILEKQYNYSAQIVTNGYYLTREVAKDLVKDKVSHVQITLDGIAEFHDKRRYLKNGGATFEKIIKNIKENCDLFKINIRVNVDKENISNISGLLDVLDREGLKGKVSLYIAPVDNKTGSRCDENSCFNDEEYAEAQIKFYVQNSNRGYVFIKSPSFRPSICGAISCSSYIIDPKGDMYKCWDDIGVEKEKIGNIKEGEAMSSKHIDWLHYSIFDNDECKNCKVLPLCMGGCPNKPVKGKMRKCHPYKYNIEKYLQLLKGQAETLHICE